MFDHLSCSCYRDNRLLCVEGVCTAMTLHFGAAQHYDNLRPEVLGRQNIEVEVDGVIAQCKNQDADFCKGLFCRLKGRETTK